MMNKTNYNRSLWYVSLHIIVIAIFAETQWEYFAILFADLAVLLYSNIEVVNGTVTDLSNITNQKNNENQFLYKTAEELKLTLNHSKQLNNDVYSTVNGLTNVFHSVMESVNSINDIATQTNLLSLKMPQLKVREQEKQEKELVKLSTSFDVMVKKKK